MDSTQSQVKQVEPPSFSSNIQSINTVKSDQNRASLYISHWLPNAQKMTLALCTSVALYLSGCGSEQAPQTQAAQMAGMPVSVIKAKAQSYPVTFQTIGKAEGSKQVDIRARVPGHLERRLFKEGSRVNAGETLYLIEKAQYQIELQQAKASLAQHQARLDQARRELRRLKTLSRDNAISRREYDNAESEEQLASAAVDTAKANVKEAELKLSYTTITAPVSGIAGRSIKSEGALLSAGGDEVLTEIVQTDPLWVRFALSEYELDLVQNSTALKVTLLSPEGKTLISGGTLNYTGSSIDAQMGTVQARAEFPNPELTVLPGQFVHVHIEAGSKRAFAVPQSAVFQAKGGKAIWVARENQATTVQVSAGAWAGQNWLLHDGLNEGDLVIIDNLVKLRPGAPVTPHITNPESSVEHVSAH